MKTNATNDLDGGTVKTKLVSDACMEYIAYADACERAGVGDYCSHGFHWDRCLDGCRMNEEKGLIHFEQKVGDKRYICRGHG
jgi:hypothetical protein